MEQAKKFILDAQGLRTSRQCRSIKAVAQRIHNIQIDTISVVSRSHNLITFNRFKKYKDGSIWKELERGNLFEYWSHSMCLMPMEVYPFYAWKMKQFRNLEKSWWIDWGRTHTDIVESVYDHVKKNGATMSKHLGEKNRKTDGWWDWKVEKRALDYLHTIGRLMIAYREGFQKCYDLTERVLPAGQDSAPMADEDVPRFMIETLLKSLGLANYLDIKSYFGNLSSNNTWGSKKSDYEKGFETFIDEGFIEEVSIEGLNDRYFVLKKNAKKLTSDSPDIFQQTPVSILTPFDNIARERHLLEKLWKFEYSLESYVPAKKRKYGYFVLPILDGIDFIGRVDAKVHRKDEVLELKALYLENPIWEKEDGMERLILGLQEFAEFHNSKAIKITSTEPMWAKSSLTKSLHQLS